MTNGLIVGKFLPLHNGHIFFINKAATYVNKLFVVVESNVEADQQTMGENHLKYPDLLTRMKWLTSIYKDTPHVEIISMSFDASKIQPNHDVAWAAQVQKLVGAKIDVIFSSNKNNATLYSEVFPEVKQIFLDKNGTSQKIPRSADIRRNIYLHWNKMPSVVRSFYVKKIAVVGAESVGKTTLVRAMAKAFGTSWSEEYGRQYCEDKFGRWFDKNHFVLTGKNDYEQIVINQEAQNEKAFLTANKVALIDTDAIYTQSFYEFQFEEKNMLIEEFIKKQQRDFIYVFLDANVPFVPDGFRLNKNHKIKRYYEKYVKFNYEISDPNYTERFDQLFNILKKEINPHDNF